LVLDSTILENIPMESNHQLNWNITLSDVVVCWYWQIYIFVAAVVKKERFDFLRQSVE
jgi:hypothetical protein